MLVSQYVTLLGSRFEAGARWAPGWAAEVRALWTDVCVWSLVQPCLTLCDPMDSVHQAPLSMGFSRQTIGVGCHFPPPGDLPYPGTEPWSFVSPALAGRFLTTRTTWEAPQYDWCKTQNSGLRSKEEKPRDPINQPSRCNTQEGLLSVVQTGDSDLMGGRAHQTANWASFLYAKKKTYYQHITYGLQSDWLHVYKAILLAQTSRAFVQT